MPYGIKRGYKAPGEFGVGDIFGLGLAGSAGIIAALVTDFQQQGEASALFTINKWVISFGALFGFTDIPLWMVIVGLTALGAGSIFYFQPITRQGAFAQGVGLLAVLMTAVPPDLAGGIESISDSLRELESADLPREARYGGRVVPAAYVSGDARLYRTQSSEAAKYDVRLTIIFPDGALDDVDAMIRRGSLRGRLHNENTGETWNLFRSAGGTVHQNDNAIVIMAGVSARANSARLWVRIECAGYKIEEQSALASMGAPLDWRVEMQPSNTPLFLQRLGKSYWF